MFYRHLPYGYILVDCLKSLGVSTSRIIPDADMTASSQYDSKHAPLGGRLNFQAQITSQGVTTQIGGWSALTNDQNQYISITFGQITRLLEWPLKADKTLPNG